LEQLSTIEVKFYFSLPEIIIIPDNSWKIPEKALSTHDYSV